jgi:Virulence factor BrkB
LSWCLTSLAYYDATYGSLGAGIGMMMWMWISSIVILFGAQLNSEMERQTIRDSTIQGEKPLFGRCLVQGSISSTNFGMTFTARKDRPTQGGSFSHLCLYQSSFEASRNASLTSPAAV